MKSLDEIQAEYVTLCEALQLKNLELKERLVKANYKLDLAKVNVELARLAGSELDLALAVYKKAQAAARVAKVIAAGIQFEIDAERRLEELELETFRAVAQCEENAAKADFNIKVGLEDPSGESWRWDMTV